MSSYVETSTDESRLVPANSARRDTLSELQEVLRSALDEDGIAVTRDTKLRDTDAWDWVMHATFLLEVESVFQVRSTISEMAYLKTFGDLADLIDAKRRIPLGT